MSDFSKDNINTHTTHLGQQTFHKPVMYYEVKSDDCIHIYFNNSENFSEDKISSMMKKIRNNNPGSKIFFHSLAENGEISEIKSNVS